MFTENEKMGAELKSNKEISSPGRAKIIEVLINNNSLLSEVKNEIRSYVDETIGSEPESEHNLEEEKKSLDWLSEMDTILKKQDKLISDLYYQFRRLKSKF